MRIPEWLLLIGPALLLIQLLVRRWDVSGVVCRLSLPRFALVYGAVWAMAVSMLPLGYRPFVYFQF